MSLKLSSWNINSVRLRVDLIERFLTLNSPDVICLQEVKCKESDFPSAFFQALGYRHIAVNGQKGYHGVAVVSRKPFVASTKKEFCNKGDARHICVEFSPGTFSTKKLSLHNVYVPAGGDLPDAGVNEKFAHKLAFLDEMKLWMSESHMTGEDAILVGDLNVAPLETDVWNHRAMLKVVSHTPVEVEKLTAAFLAGRWVDGLRLHVPPDKRLFTWWSYRSPNWELADKGRRLDHVWTSPGIAANLTDVGVLREARGWTRPSDHVPVSAHFS